MEDNHCPECGEETIGGTTCVTCRVELLDSDENGPDLYDLVTDHPSEPPEAA